MRLFHLFKYFCTRNNFTKMKSFFYLLSVVILVLGCLPCSDGNTINGNKETVNISIDLHQDETQKHTDICNPFCSCACCGVSQASPTNINVDPQIANHSSIYLDTYSAFPIIAISLPIWQPPQLV